MARDMREQGETRAGAPSRDLFERNMAWLRATAPSLHERLATMSAPAGRVVVDPGDPNDINFLADGRLFFADGAITQARRDVDAFLSRPEKVSWAPLRPGGKSPIVDPLRERIDAFVAAIRQPAGGVPAHHRAAALVSLGIGLGTHLACLMEKLEIRHIIAVEPIPDFLWHSLWLQDWAGWDDTLRARGGTLKLVAEEDPEHAADMIDWHLAEHCMPTIDGTYIHQGYASGILQRCKLDLYERLRSVRGEGFFEDEIRMLVNASANLAQADVRLVTNAKPVAQPLPVFIVGSGPSLDAALPHLSALRDRAVLFSAGTALGTLLRAGLTPDFQFEIENRVENYEGVAAVAAQFDLTDVTLIAAAAVDRRMPPLFGRHILYLRDNNMSAAIYGNDETTIHGTSPNCMTLAIRMAAAMGFGDVYLFGADFGSRHPTRHHASNSIWTSDPAWAERYARVAEAMTIELPGNFGGRVYTNRMLRLFLTHAQNLIRASAGMTFHNCSDGARIRGAVPRMPGQVKLPPPAVAADIVVAGIRARTVEAPRPDAVTLNRYATNFRLWVIGLAATLTRLRDAGTDLIGWHDAIFGSLGTGEDAAARRIMVQGSLTMMMRHALYYALRHDLLADPAFLAQVHDGLVEALRAMADQVDAATANVLTESRQ